MLELFTSNYLLRVTAKDLSIMLGVSISSAGRYLLDIKKEFKIKVVCFGHVVNYFKLSYETSQKYSKTLKNIQNSSK